jgi:hypothetical protein
MRDIAGTLQAVATAIADTYLYLDAERVERLTGRAIYYVMK